ncbi:MAG: 50S ribosomal protein L10 [Clostridia bacterium]|nr:50S ribosomal protein L10 [Clostridia bacterium]
MPSQKILEEKKGIVAGIKDDLTNSKATVIVDGIGLTVEEDTALRVALRQAGVKYAVHKNTLITKAVEGTELEGLKDYLKGPSAIATASDYTAAAKVLTEYAKKYKNLTVKCGFCEGQVLDPAGVERLSNIPSREGLLSMLLSALTGNLRGFAVAVKAVAEKKEQGA